jgi:Na+-driven multidrug efflux pump
MPLLISFLNKMLFLYAGAVFVLGVYYRISTFVIMPILGLNQGALPIMGYNYGAKNRLRLTAVFKSALTVALIIMIAGTSFFMIFAYQIMTLFSASDETMELGVTALRIISIAWIPAAYAVITVALFQALAYGVFALVVSITRQIGLVLPLAWILLTHFGLNAVWYSYPLAEIGSVVVTLILHRWIYKNKIKYLPDGMPVSGSGERRMV